MSCWMRQGWRGSGNVLLCRTDLSGTGSPRVGRCCKLGTVRARRIVEPTFALSRTRSYSAGEVRFPAIFEPATVKVSAIHDRTTPTNGAAFPALPLDTPCPEIECKQRESQSHTRPGGRWLHRLSLLQRIRVNPSDRQHLAVQTSTRRPGLRSLSG
jgi:hypothetical protein